MLNRIIHFSINNKGIIGSFIVLLVLVGIYSATRLPIDAVPDITNNQVQVITQAPTLGAQEVEQFITAPIELSLSNIPDVIEKRSISRSGISVITIVFKDKTDIYWARQQVSERLKEAEAQIPQGLGEPSLAPITTGLGEIYHYVIHTKPGYENKYTATDLRTIQDWIVRRQLAGTEGVAEVSGWGGYVKQYEIALDNNKLNAMNISIPEIYTALEENNQNTGGSYIEQRSNAYFIRGLGMVQSLSDIEKIVVKRVNGIPVLIRDVATVQYGSATRYGAVTRNGEGEVVAGVVLMLKGENFSKVIANVKERMTQIQKSLPEGIVIEPFIDRTELVDRAMGTVERNLIEGALIVIFVLVLLLGDWRAGLLVASVIPLAMLFAITMMNLFGVSGNLMSLGAIDFGLIVDGAVIIVESVVHRITSNQLSPPVPKLSKEQMNENVFQSAKRMMSSASFGQIIILIVYLPIFSLVGIEGKMFRPMAETVAFAILGAFILSLTYVPMMSAWVLSRKTEHKRNISDRIMGGLYRVYAPALNTVTKKQLRRIGVILVSVGLLLWSTWRFLTMGGEFIPTLEEGDLTVEISMMQGTSLTQTVETFTQAEKILKAQFPEIKQVVTRIGSAEIPTDPMPIERGDMMLSMKPKEEWTHAHSREEMVEKIEDALSVLPGVNVEVTQPMQMRFNELMTGIRQDVAVKIYGDDLDVLTEKANEVAKLIAPVKGVSEPIVEKITGLPQIVVDYDRDKMAQYGLNVSDVNEILKTAFAGEVTGVVFEGEKRFEMVVRLQKDSREDVSNIENLFIPLPSGDKVPLSQVAKIEFRDAPAQVSRDDGKRRVYVGFNVRNRDVESVVKDVQKILDEKLKLPPGYYTTYGGQFQNLKEAKDRLSIAVPVALALILVLLFFTFRSVKQTLLIFSAVPFSAIGGVWLLWMRGMPFSISAGIGFIALFGVAVLNGIVLIAYFNQLEEEGVSDIYERVRKGTKARLRPVIMTAAVASLGFLPMALSTNAGAEVQKPLATVVIGGLISATLLTLLVLPVLYILFSNKSKSNPMKVSVNSLLIVLLAVAGMFVSTPAHTQNTPLTLDDCIAMAVKNNPQMTVANLETQQSQAIQKTGFNPDKTDFTVTQDPTAGGNIDNSWGITQRFAFPTVYTSQNRVLREETKLSQQSATVTQNELVKNVKLAYYQLLYAQERLVVLQKQDSLYADFARRAEVRFNVGETSVLEKIAAVNKSKEVQLQRQQAEADVTIAMQQLQQLLNTTSPITIADTHLIRLDGTFMNDTNATRANPMLGFYRQRISVASFRVRAERNLFLPDLMIGYSNQFIISSFNPAGINREYFPGTRIGGIQFGISVPLFFNAQYGRSRYARLGVQIAQVQLQQATVQLNTAYSTQYQQYVKLMGAVSYYENGGLQQADELQRASQVSYNKGEIGYVEYMQNISQSTQTRLNYLETLHEFNEAVINLSYLSATK